MLKKTYLSQSFNFQIVYLRSELIKNPKTKKIATFGVI